MNIRRLLGFSVVAAAASISLPALLSAQGDAASRQQPVTDFNQGMTVELWGYTVEADSGAIVKMGGANQHMLMRNAVISHSQ